MVKGSKGMPRRRGAKSGSKVVHLVTEKLELIVTAPLNEVLSFVKQDDIKTRFGGKKLLVLEPISEIIVEEPDKALLAAQDLLKKGWSKEDVCKVLGLKDVPEMKVAETKEQIPSDWMDEDRVTVLRQYVKILLPDEDVSKWNKDACKATLNKMLTVPQAPKVELAEIPTDTATATLPEPQAPVVEPAKEAVPEEVPWDEEENTVSEEATAQEEQPQSFTPPPLPPDMPVVNPLAPPPMVPPPVSPINPAAPPIAPASPKTNWAPPPIPSPFRKK